MGGTLYLDRLLLQAHMLYLTPDKLQLSGQDLGRVFNSKNGCVHAMQFICFETKLPNLNLETQPKLLLGYLPLGIGLSDLTQSVPMSKQINVYFYIDPCLNFVYNAKFG